METNELTEAIIACAYRVHNELGSGYLEKVYENALCIELEEAGFRVAQQKPIPVNYRGHVVGDFFADLLVEERLVIELKAVRKLAKEHEVQLVSYLQTTRIDDGLLINFGSSVEVRRKFRQMKSDATGLP